MHVLKKVMFLIVLISVAALALAWDSAGAAEKKMRYEEYQSLLAGHIERENTAKSAIAELQKQIDLLREDMKRTEDKIAATQNEIYGLIKSDEAGVKKFEAELDKIASQIQGLRALSADELYKRAGEVKALREKLNTMKANPICYLPEMRQKAADIDQMLVDLEVAVPKVAPPDYYTVVKGDCLWLIAGKKQVYGDPYLWPRIYRENKDKIKNPDLIYPKWVLTIPRGVAPGQHLVVRGEWLSKISGYAKIYGDPTKWTKIYQANKDQIKNPNLIYPAQVLGIPRD